MSYPNALDRLDPIDVDITEINIDCNLESIENTLETMKTDLFIIQNMIANLNESVSNGIGNISPVMTDKTGVTWKIVG